MDKELTEFDSPEDAFKEVRKILSDWKEKNRKEAGKVFSDYLSNYRRETKELLREIAEDSDWRVREEAAKIWSVALTYDFEWYSWYQKLVETGTINLRRAVLVGAKYSV